VCVQGVDDATSPALLGLVPISVTKVNARS
jgi:hypothetical protein